MSLEIEARFSTQKGELMLIAWFEGESIARLVMTGPAGEREEVQVNGIEASLTEEVNEAMNEAQAHDTSPGGITARLQVATNRSRVGRAVKLGKNTKADHLCGKLVAIADLLSKDQSIKRTLGVLKKQLNLRELA